MRSGNNIGPRSLSLRGICNLAGNVSEWISGWYQADFYQSCAASTNCGTSDSLFLLLHLGGDLRGHLPHGVHEFALGAAGLHHGGS